MYLKLYFIALPIFLVIDFIWLAFVAKNFYSQQIGHLMKSDVNFLAAFIFYLLFIVGLVFFVISPGLEKNSLQYVIISGALFGLITYATYDLTNLATLKNWPILITIIDLVWGTFLSLSVSLITFIVSKKIGL